MNRVEELGGLVAAVLFVLAIKGLSRPRTAVRANLIGALGMLLAVGVALTDASIVRFEDIVAGILIGTVISIPLAMKTPLTAMPEMVAMFNGFGGLASVLVAERALLPGASGEARWAAYASGLVGGVTFAGSLVAFLKLREMWGLGKSVGVPRVVNGVLGLLLLGVSVQGASSGDTSLYWVVSAAAGVLGVLLTIPIGGADMPVVIALLNAYSGIAASASGFAIDSTILIVSGALVGASGVLLTRTMCKAMNRPLWAVVFPKPGVSGGGVRAEEQLKTTSAEEVAMLLEAARKVVIAPGYGLAVAQAQHALKELAVGLEKRGIEVMLAIHPVAGRMPGHMNVLLAEAEIDYEKTKELSEINPSMKDFDVAIVVGANDVVNPIAKTDPTSPIAGMPILEVGQARTVVVIKRGRGKGFAGIANPLFSAPNTLMLFGDAKAVLVELAGALST